MRVVFQVEREIEGFAEAGDHVVLALDGDPYPVSVVRDYSRSAVETLILHSDHLSLSDPDDPLFPSVLSLLRRVSLPLRMLK